jgi:type I restriction enzyme M protein
VKCVNPELGKVIVDPCCGSGGFLLAAKDFLQGKYTTMTGQQTDDLKLHTFYGTEIVPNTYRLCLMNLLLHGIGEFGGVPPIKCADSLASAPSDNDLCEYVMTNPPFGKKSSTTIEVQEEDKETGEVVTKIKKAQDNYVRADFIATTSNKQLNFLQHIKSLLKVGGTAAVVLPDNVLFEGGAGETIRKNILKTCDLHTILRLPTGLFYAQGVKANVLFFEKKPTSENAQTKEVWIYDYRTNVKHTLKQNPLRETDLQDFVDCYRPDDRHHRQETYHAESNPDGRWRKFTYDEVLGRDKTSLDITWIKQGEESEDLSLPELISIIKEKSNNITEAVAELEKLLENLES